MARKLSSQERENINYLTDVLCRALPAAQRSYSGALASALVRIRGDQITDSDLDRVTAKYDELQSALIEVLKAEVLDRVPAVDAKGDGEAFTLRVPEQVGAADDAAGNGEAVTEGGAADKTPANEAAADAEPNEAPAAGEKGGEPEKKPARKRRARRKKAAEPEVEAAGVAVAEAEPEVAETQTPAAEESQPKPKSVRPGRGARAARAKAKAAEAVEAAEAKSEEKEPVEAAVAEPAAQAEEKAEAPSAEQEPKKRTRTRSRRGKKAEAPAEAKPAVPEPAATDAAPEPAAHEDVADAATEAVGDAAASGQTPEEKPTSKRRPRRRRTRKPVEDVVVTGAEAEALLAKEGAEVEAEVAGAASGTVDAPEGSVSDEENGSAAVEEANVSQADGLLAADGAEGEAPAEGEESAGAEAADTSSAGSESTEGSAGEAPSSDGKHARQSGRARVRGRGRRGLDKRPRGENLSDIPYVRRGGESEAALREQIVQLDSRLWMNGWLLSHPGAFKLYERELRGIDEALQKGELPGDLTRRQLAYKMGGNEKFFEYGSDGFRLLRAMGADDLIHHRPMPKADMLYHVPRRRKSMRILVTENLDPWLDVRDLMYEDGRSLILGERVHGVVLGGGNPVVENNRISGLLEALGADTIEVLYWGDIDRAGLSLLQRLQVLLDGQYKVTPFMPAYRLMLERAMERYPDPDQNERTTQENVEVADYSQMLEGLSDDERAYFSSIIEKCGLIPQEILTKADL